VLYSASACKIPSQCDFGLAQLATRLRLADTPHVSIPEGVLVATRGTRIGTSASGWLCWKTPVLARNDEFSRRTSRRVFGGGG